MLMPHAGAFSSFIFTEYSRHPHRVDSYQWCFFVGAALFVIFTAWHGWRLGIARQLINLLALAAAYLIGYFGGANLSVLIHRFVDIPERALSVLCAVGLGFIIYCCIMLLGVIAFKTTAQQKVGVMRLSYGIAGSACGAFYGVFLVWITVLAIRLLGSVAESEISAAAGHPAASRAHLAGGAPISAATPAPVQPNAMIRTLAHMKQSLEQGPAGDVVQHVDPIPGTLYSILHKLGAMVSNDKSVDRFLAYPGVKPLLAHPKIAALQNDPEIVREIVNRDYFALIRNPRIITAARDSEISQLMHKFEFEKALDYAIQPNAGAPQPTAESLADSRPEAH